MFLDAGYSPSLFWESSLGEIYDLLESFSRRKKIENEEKEAEIKLNIIQKYNQAMQIANCVGRLLNDETEILGLEHYYPDLFNGKTDEEKDKERIEMEIKIHKANMDDFVFRHNLRMQKMRERGEHSGSNDTRETQSNN